MPNTIRICLLCDEKDNQIPLLVCGHYICCACYTQLKCNRIDKCPFCFDKLRRRTSY